MVLKQYLYGQYARDLNDRSIKANTAPSLHKLPCNNSNDQFYRWYCRVEHTVVVIKGHIEETLTFHSIYLLPVTCPVTFCDM